MANQGCRLNFTFCLYCIFCYGTYITCKIHLSLYFPKAIDDCNEMLWSRFHGYDLIMCETTSISILSFAWTLIPIRNWKLQISFGMFWLMRARWLHLWLVLALLYSWCESLLEDIFQLFLCFEESSCCVHQIQIGLIRLWRVLSHASGNRTLNMWLLNY